MKFVLGTNSLTLDDEAQYPLKDQTELIQVAERSATGVKHIETFPVQLDTITYNFKDMTDSDYDNLMDWFLNKAEGMKNEFDLTNDLGDTATVRFTTPRLDFSLNYKGLWSGKIVVEEVTTS